MTHTISPNNGDAERAELEAWAKSEHENLGGEYAGPGNIGWRYWDDLTAAAWEAWQAARRSPVADAAGELPVPWNARITEDERMHDDHAVIESMRAEIADLREQLAAAPMSASAQPSQDVVNPHPN